MNQGQNQEWEKCPHCFGVGGHASLIMDENSNVAGAFRVKCVWCSGSGSIHHDLVLQYFYFKSGHSTVDRAIMAMRNPHALHNNPYAQHNARLN